jgi:hypothetical protein
MTLSRCISLDLSLLHALISIVLNLFMCIRTFDSSVLRGQPSKSHVAKGGLCKLCRPETEGQSIGAWEWETELGYSTVFTVLWPVGGNLSGSAVAVRVRLRWLNHR